ncbi:VOC family protein [Noviherbaspirillum saxi]|uniref:VOC family protein n=1 Tax=Noviherbaspirillum saxi TaxID=2320863 RepID=A0A3A3G9J3_9BURK|nr:VOC family protein [Noviherbaspirillum saxi]RJF98835.1 VOC family protein [Noviherbaspirillum saxi]
MTTVRLDHLVIVADNLEQGCDHCESMLGVRPEGGGEHQRMGTHNRLLRLGDDCYLEVISINPTAQAPDRARWFGMDDPAQHARVRARPFLATFACNTSEIDAAVAALPALGEVRAMQRGSLHWQITIRADGALVEHGAVPSLIQWPQGVHPVRGLPVSGRELLKLEARHADPERLLNQWRQLGITDARLSAVQAGAGEDPGLIAHISTPTGVKIIS